MVKLPEKDRAEYLINRRFPFAKWLDVSPSLSSTQPPPRVEPGLREKVEAYRAELAKLSNEELEARYNAERAKQGEQDRQKAEAEERNRFFNKPFANADFDHWSKAAYWSLDEAIALSFGKAPEYVGWVLVSKLVDVSAFALQYARRRDLALRAVQWNELFDPVPPSIFLQWANRTGIELPPALIAALEARGARGVDWKKRYDDLLASARKNEGTQLNYQQQLEAQIATLSARVREIETTASATTERPLGTRERESLLKLVIGLAMGGYGYDPAAARSEQPQAIADDLLRLGVPLDVDTVRKWLQEAAAYVSPQELEHPKRAGKRRDK